MISECREILEGIARVQTAGMLATGIMTVRGVQRTLQHGEAIVTRVSRMMGQPESSPESDLDGALRDIYDGHVDYLREVVGLPRLTFMFFLGELHRLRTFTEEDQAPPA